MRLIRGLFVFTALLFTAAILEAQDLAQVLSGARIVFLSNSAVEAQNSSSLITQAQTELGAIPATSWEEVIVLNNVAPIQALVIDSSAWSSTDRNWLSSAYANGLPIGVLNVPVQDFAGALDDPCLTRDNFAQGYAGEFYIIASQMYLGDNPTDVARVVEARRSSCGDVSIDDLTGPVYFGISSSTSELDAEGYTEFRAALASHLVRLAALRDGFTNRTFSQSR
jgi:hypothetical protein